MLDRRSCLVCFCSLIGSLAIAYGFCEPFEKRRAKQHELKSLGAFSVAFDANGSVSSARFRQSIAPGFSEACGKLQVVDLKGAVGIRQSLQVLTRLESLRMVVLSVSDVRDEDIQLLPQIAGLKHIWMTNTKLTDQCVEDLARIERLEIVKLDGTEISAEGIERLRLLKPKVKIEGVAHAE
ncbi:MAG: hypothetical protein MUF23_06655 [Pirellula sp.]|nr:hypothetical protein [Pirellula sp.]